MDIVDLRYLAPKSVEEAVLAGDLAGSRVDLGLIEALKRPKEVVSGLEANGGFRVADEQAPGGNAATREAKGAFEIRLRVLKGL